MKKLLLLLFIFLFGISNAYAYDVSSSFYYDDDKVVGMWITREKESIVMSGLPFFLKRKGDDKVVYCLEPFVMLKQEEGYEGYYQLNSYFNLDEEKLERIRLLSYFGYMYPGHEEDIWYGVTQYLIWKTVDEEANIYFVDVRYGDKIDAYIEEIKEIETLISDYKKLLEHNDQVYRFNNMDEYLKFKDSNLFLRDIEITNNFISIPFNNNVSNQEIFYYHKDGQNLYLPGVSFSNEINIEIIFTKNVMIKKWYGSGKYKEEEGAFFEICEVEGKCYNVETDEKGEANIELDYGEYTIKQLKGKKGYRFIEETYFEVNDNSSNILELYNEAIVIEVPDTYKGNFVTDIIMKIKWKIYDYKYR